MKILFLTHRLPFAPNRGDRIRAYYLLQAMSRFAEVSLFSLTHDNDEHAQARNVPFATAVRCAPVHRLRGLVNGARWLPSGRPLTHSLLDAPTAAADIEALVGASPPDLVVAFCSGMARFAFLPPLEGRPTVIDFVDVDSAKFATLADGSWGPRRWICRREAVTLGRFEAMAATRAGLALVCNERERNLLRTMAPSAPVEAVENGVDVEAFRPSSAPEQSSIVTFCGVMDYGPNGDGVRWFAESVWPSVVARRPNARFVVVGSNPTAQVKALAQRHSSIEVVGRVQAVQPYLWRSAVSVAPLRVARGVQNKVLEALAAGLPAVVTSVVNDGLPVEARSGCTVADDARSFADAVVAALDRTPAERRRAAAVDLGALGWSRRLASVEAMFTRVASAR